MLSKNKRCHLNFIKLFIIIVILAFISQVYCNVVVFAEEMDENIAIIDEQTESNEANKINDQLRKYSSEELKEIFPEYDPQKIIKDAAKGNFNLSITGIINRVLMYLFKEIYLNINILIKLIVLVILCAILKNLQTSFLSESVGQLAFYVCYIVIVSIMIVSFNTAIVLAKEIIDSMVSFMHASIPVLITLLISSGNITSGGIFQPILIMVVEVAATVLRDVLIPLIFLSTILSIVNNISDKVQLSKLAGFLKQIGTWTIGFILTLFIAVITIQGSLGAVVDGVTGKTAKFAIGTFIPVAGKYLADAADTVVSCALLIKNAAGIAVMIGVIAICIVPLLKILALIVLYKLTCALIEPISEERITNCLNDMASSLTFVLGIVASVTIMFLISITVIISASNISAMVR